MSHTPLLKFPSLLALLLLATQASCGTQFGSHVSVSTPTRSFFHGVGDPLPTRFGTPHHTFRDSSRPSFRQRHTGYPRVKPGIPFNNEEVYHGSSFGKNNAAPWPYNNQETNIPLLPPSPYRVWSPDPESLWPEGLFVAPAPPPRFTNTYRRADTVPESLDDPYLLEGSEAIAAVRRSREHGLLYFHDIPHITSLLENQELRLKNNLEPHILGSIRQSWPYYRP